MQTIVKKMSILPAAHYQEERSTVSPDRHQGMEGVMVKRNPDQVNLELSKVDVIPDLPIRANYHKPASLLLC